MRRYKIIMENLDEYIVHAKNKTEAREKLEVTAKKFQTEIRSVSQASADEKNYMWNYETKEIWYSYENPCDSCYGCEGGCRMREKWREIKNER